MLSTKEVAGLLSVSEKTIYRWISKEEMPVYKIGDTYRFNRVELLEWTTAKKIKVSYKIFEDDSPAETPGVVNNLAGAINLGGIYYHVSGENKEAVLKSIVNLMNLPDDIDKDFLSEALIARENLGSTAIGHGIAIPHVRHPVIFHIEKPIISLCFLEEPRDFNSIDGQYVDTVFTIMASSIKSHFSILSRLNYALHLPEVREKIKSSSSRKKIIDAVSEVDDKINANKTKE